MTPIFFNSSSNTYPPYPDDHYQDHLHTHQFLSPNSQASSSSSRSLSTHMFLSSNDQNRAFISELQSTQYHHEGDNYGSQAYNDHGIENNMNSDLHQVKWMSSKMRVMLKMKKSDQPMNRNAYSSATSRELTSLEEHKLSSSTIEETDHSNNSTSSNSNTPVRVCSDCNTTKTPLWRSGPRGPKSLCNACGIRQRKARRAAAVAAAAENNNNGFFNDQYSVMTPSKVTKTQHKGHKRPSYKGHVTKYKKRQCSKQITTTSPPSPPPSPPSSSPVRKNCLEDFLVSLSKNLTFYHVLPQDEKEAAILLMAISCGYAHET